MKKKFIAFFLMIVMMSGLMIGTRVVYAATTNLVDTYKPFNKSSSFKEFATGGENSLSMGGKKYQNAFALDFYATDSSASYNIEGLYNTFTGIVGVPQNYSVGTTVNIYGDNSLLKSMEVSPDQLPQKFSLNVSAISNLKFEVLETSANINGFYTYIGFAELELSGGSASAPDTGSYYDEDTTDSYSGSGIGLVDNYQPFNKSDSFKDYPTSGDKSFSMGGKDYKNSFVLDFYAVNGSASYNIEGKYKTLTGIVGVPKNYSVGTTVNIYGDNSLLKSMEISADQLPQKFTLNVSGISNLKFEVLETSANINGFYTYIGFAELMLSGGTANIPTSTPKPSATPKPTPSPTPTPTPSQEGSNPGGFDLEAIQVGVKLKWNRLSGGVGYRLYRSDNSRDDGISITDFYITSNEFVDVNVDANETYYYTVRQVLAEAKPFDGLPEKLGPASSKIKVTTGSEILGGNASDTSSRKKFILMTLDDPYMSVNGVREEIDPGRGTTPLILNSRTMVPIRAIVEAMNGTVGWNDYTRKITLDYNSQSVVMTLNNKNITVNGSSKAIDVAPTVINSRTMVPIRFAAENLGCQVDWLNSTRQIVIVYR